ncbi:LAMI_0H02762g1_1 [Lachancea mirantina]|uniref:Vacuolar protein sorting-associated protein 29 n=1 Tax=Lachancea mirantina TaxID=1230905 RepID=A0A1G4KE65_9SACH|nr:LAMI_0H02762g1_1 [Lachancea mirantina]
MLLLALSDAHIPDREKDVPAKFKKLLSVPDKISQVVLLGNCTKSLSFLQFVNGISTNVVIVRGEFDNGTIATTKKSHEDIPINTIIKQGNFRIGCCNGYTVVPKSDPLSLLTLARQLDVDIVLWGGTHNVEAYTLEGKFFINPGSCTGAFSTDWVVQDRDLVSENSTEAKGDNAQEDEKQEKGQSAQPQQDHEQDGKTASATENEDNVSQESPVQPGDASADPANDGKDSSDDDSDIDPADINGGCVPSFCLLDIQGSTCTLYIYTYVDQEVKVDKVVYRKDT